MKRSKLRALGRGLRGVFHGWSDYGDTTKATLYIGAKTGLNTSNIPEGKTIPKKTILGTIVGLRVEQAGPKAGLTATIAEGRYKGTEEPSYKIEFFHDGSEKTTDAFAKNIRKLAQEAATALAQREIIVELTKDGHSTKTFSASPTKAPGPGTSAFCTWVRERSESAQTNPHDPCYRKPQRKKPR